MKQKKVAVVTGGSSGMGLAIASVLVKHGILTVIVSRNKSKLDFAMDKLRGLGEGLAFAFVADVTKSEEINNCIDKIIKQHGKIDYLINSAGVSIHGPFLELDERDWNEVVDTNLKGTFLACKAVWSHMLNNLSSERQIVTISSASGMSGYSGGSIYCASKFGVNGLMEALVLEGQEVGIKVSTIIPGPVDTPIWNPNDELVNQARPKMLTAESIAETVYFVISSSANTNYRKVVVHPFEVQPYLKGRNKGHGGVFPKNPNSIPTDKNKTFSI